MTTRSHRDTGQLKITELLVILSEFTFALEHCDTDFGLVISSGGESLGLLGRNGSVSADQTSKNTSHSLDTQRQWSNIEEENVLYVTGQDSALNSSTDSDGFVGVDGTVGLFAEEGLDEFLNFGHTGGATNE